MRSYFFGKYIYALLLLLLLCSCEEPYLPNVIDSPNRFLVVTGFINSGNGITTIRLSRTQNLSDTNPAKAETGAQVIIEEEPGRLVATLSEVTAGTYSSTHKIDFNLSGKYRIRIKSGGKEYASAFVAIKKSPAIDSLSWEANNERLQIYVNTHDSQNSTRYYRWEFEETWEFVSDYYSTLEYSNKEVVERLNNDIYRCWQTSRSSNIILGNSTKLSQDVIREAPLHAQPSSSQKLVVKYSILAKQYALTREEFEYWDILKRNTETIGTLFDPMPAQLRGNITCLSDPAEPVIGFIGATTMEEKRIFITRAQLPSTWRKPGTSCVQDTIEVTEAEEYLKAGWNIPVSEYRSESYDLLGYFISTRGCVDCTTRGTNVAPAFWK